MTSFNHFNFNVLDLNKSLEFYRQALGLAEVRRKETEPFTLAYLGTAPYNLGEGEFHLAFVTDEYDALYAKHKAMGCVCFENPAMGIYFIADPDGYWIEIVPQR